MSRRTSARKEITIEIDPVKIISAAATVLMCVLFIFCAALYIRQFMKISKFEVSGDCPYEKEVLVNASGLKYGEKLYSVNSSEVEKKMLAECPYLESVKIESKFPNKIKFTVECVRACWYVEISGDYYALDEKMRVLEETYSNSKFISGGVTKLTLPDIKSAMVGSTLVYGDESVAYKAYDDLMTVLRTSVLKSRITLADIDNRLEIYLEVDGKYKVYMGNNSNTEAKLSVLMSVLESDTLNNCVSAEIDVSDPSKTVSVRPVYASTGGVTGSTDSTGTSATGGTSTKPGAAG